MYDVVALGELLIDFTTYGRSDMGHPLYEQNLGGAPANLLCGLSGLGHRTAFIGKVGADMFGDDLRRILDGRGVDTRGLVQDADVFTTLAFVALDDDGERSFAFARKPGADTCLRTEEIDPGLIGAGRVFHTSAFQMTHEPARSATLWAAEQARAAGVYVAFDPNYRDVLWGSEGEAVTEIKKMLPLVDLLKVSHGEAALITGEADPERAAEILVDMGIPCVAVTLGREGALALSRSGAARVPALPVKAVDTTGAGDAFWSGFLSGFLDSGVAPGELSDDQLRDCCRMGSATAAISVGRRGAISAPITRAGVAEILAQYSL